MKIRTFEQIRALLQLDESGTLDYINISAIKSLAEAGYITSDPPYQLTESGKKAVEELWS